jgi:hypothetical protein
MSVPILETEQKITYKNTTMYKNNTSLIAKTKATNYKKGLCLTEK